MNGRILPAMPVALLVLMGTAVSAGALISGGGVRHAYTEDFFIEECTFAAEGSNPYMVLVPGHRLTLEGFEGKEFVRLDIEVLDDTETVAGVRTRVVKETEYADGVLVEESWNYLAMCVETGNMFYFGEDVDIYEDGGVSHEGAWRAGMNDAVPGVIMPGSPMLGARYFQEMAPEVAMDRAEVIRLDAVVDTPYGTFTRCLETEETSPMEPSSKDRKFYAPQVGIIVDGPLLLTDVVAP